MVCTPPLYCMVSVDASGLALTVPLVIRDWETLPLVMRDPDTVPLVIRD
jgi:hypothetical protein